MKKKPSIFNFYGVVGKCGDLPVFLGFAPAKTLHHLSFTDILQEETGIGYQRPYNKRHSLDFKRYITTPGSSTIPLTFNLRKECQDVWDLEVTSDKFAILHIRENKKCFSQVDCQHRLGELYDQGVMLAFMTFIGLDLRSEMAQFVIINSKAKGLSSSLTDYHESQLVNDIINEAPHLYIARKLNEDPESPWYKLIRYGGKTISGLHRRTSFRMMQKSITKYLTQVKSNDFGNIDNKYIILRSYWVAVRNTFEEEWDDHRHHLITKGVGLYSLTKLLGDIVGKIEINQLNTDGFNRIIKPLKSNVDWSSKGRFSHAGGQKGVHEVYLALKEALGLEGTACRT
ncbi:MAG: DGQHR domain protein [Candidatus Gottesmanbacteria bacterium GW2011_GWC2_39_8]|uniref:DGQHR domain protein n=1 Tax=Candidatus Gottesmanbacteria bacterium GW2011_GWC2_39_8 TaxID=1618450 RepID=A0A0G0Q159_9BACT|nr:MAG: DGQHR domain protein [Candidatus Gottesmanbacteria bacterium GW2011_GWC2_39_8]